MMQGMRNRLASLRSLGRGALASKLLVGMGVVAFAGLAFVLGRAVGLGSASAQQIGVPVPLASNSKPGQGGYDPDYVNRPVAYIYENVPISRQELAEYLIARFGGERLEFLVNRAIVERKCKEKGIVVTDTEVEAQFTHDLRTLGPHMTPKLFQEQVLSRYKKTVFEWKEDVIRPKLQMAKYCRPLVVVEEADLLKGFEARYGPKVHCRMIVFQDKNMAIKTWQKIRDAGSTEKAFRDESKVQFIPQLASSGGEIPPIHKHFGDPRIEKTAFAMQPGEISEVIAMPDNTAVILMCERHERADTLKRFENERHVLHNEIMEMKLGQKISEQVVAFRREANPRLLLARPSIDQVERDAADAVKDTGLQFRSTAGGSQ